MPSMASLTVKKADGVTDIVFNQLTGAGGDASPAYWRQDTGAPAALPVGLRPYFKLMTKWNGPKTARQTIFEIVFPYAVLDPSTGLYSAKDRVVFSGIATFPQAIPIGSLNEAAAQGLNLLAQPLVVESHRVGYAPIA